MYPGVDTTLQPQPPKRAVQEYPYKGQMLLLDPRTQRVYHSPDGRSWPQLLGKLEVECRGGGTRAGVGGHWRTLENIG
jgi:hypothetical protein